MIYAKLKKFLQIFGGFAERYTFQCESGTELNEYSTCRSDFFPYKNIAIYNGIVIFLPSIPMLYVPNL